MNDGFLYKLGEFKAEKSEKGFTKIHNDTYFDIAKKLGSEACHFYTAISTYAYGASVTVFPKVDVLADRLGVSRDTIKRWKKKLVNENIIRAVPCHQVNGMRTVDVILFNAVYPEIPPEWDTFAPDGFIMIDGKPVLHEEWQRTLEIARNLVTKEGANLHLPENQRVQKCTVQNNGDPDGKSADKPHNGSGCKNAPTENSDSANLHLAQTSEIAVTVQSDGLFFQGEEEKINKTIKTVVVELATAFRETTGEDISADKMEALISQYSPEKVQEGIIIISTMKEWSAGAEGALTAALRDGWKEPKRTRNKRKTSTAKMATKGKSEEKDDRYSAFYQLYPDA